MFQFELNLQDETFSSPRYQTSHLKGGFAKNEMMYRLTAKNKRFWSLLILLLPEKIVKNYSYRRITCISLYPLSFFANTPFKGSLSVILSDRPLIHNCTLKALSDQVFIRYPCFKMFLFFSFLVALQKCIAHFLAWETMKKLS